MRSGHVFISYTQRYDSALANALNVQLASRPGVFVFQDIHAPSMDAGIGQSVFRQVQDADLLVAVVSAESASTLADPASWLFQEIDFARKLGRPIAVVAGEGFTWDLVALPDRFAFLKDVRFIRAGTDTIQGAADQIVELLRRGDAARAAAAVDVRMCLFGDVPDAARAAVVERVGGALTASLRGSSVPVDLSLKLMALPARPGHACVARAVAEALEEGRSGPLASLWTQLGGRFEIVGESAPLADEEVEGHLNVVDVVVSVGGDPAALRPRRDRFCFGERPRPWLPVPVAVLSTDHDGSRQLLNEAMTGLLGPTGRALSASALDALAGSVDGPLPRADVLVTALSQVLTAPQGEGAARLDDAQVGLVVRQVDGAEASPAGGWLAPLVAAGARRLSDRAEVEAEVLPVIEALGSSPAVASRLADAPAPRVRAAVARAGLARLGDLQRWRGTAIGVAALLLAGVPAGLLYGQRELANRDEATATLASNLENCTTNRVDLEGKLAACDEERKRHLEDLKRGQDAIVDELQKLRTGRFGVTLAQLLMGLHAADSEVTARYGVNDWHDLAETLSRREATSPATSNMFPKPTATWWARGAASNSAIKLVYLPIDQTQIREVPMSSSSFGDPTAAGPVTRCFFERRGSALELVDAERDRGASTSQCRPRSTEAPEAGGDALTRTSTMTCSVGAPDSALVCATVYDTADERRGGGIVVRPGDYTPPSTAAMMFAFGGAADLRYSTAHPLLLREASAPDGKHWLRVPASLVDDECVVPLPVQRGGVDMGPDRPTFAALMGAMVAAAERDAEAPAAGVGYRFRAFRDRLDVLVKDWSETTGTERGYDALTWSQPSWTQASPVTPGDDEATEAATVPVLGFFPDATVDVCGAMATADTVYGGVEWFIAWGHTEALPIAM